MSEPVPGKVSLRRRLLQLGVALLLCAGILSLVFALGQRARVVEPPVVDCSNVDRAVERAITAAREKVRAAPRSAKAWGHLGMVLFAHSYLPECVVCFQQAQQLDGKEPRWPYLHGLALRYSDEDTAIHNLRRAVELCGNEPDAPRLLLGELLFQQGKLDEAEQQFLAVLQQDPANGRAHLGLGRVEYERNDLSACVPHYRKAAADSRTRQMALIQLAQAYQRLGDADAAATAQNQANSLPPDDFWPDPYGQEFLSLKTGEAAALNEAYHLIAEDRATQALESLRQTLLVYPDSAGGWLLVGRALIRKEEYSAAENVLRRAISLKPDASEAQFYLGVALFSQKKPAEALPYFRKATELKADYPFAHYNTGECLRQLNDLPGAIESFRAALRCQPDLADAHLALAELLSQRGQTTEACHHVRATMSLRPQDPRALQLLDQLHCTEVTAPVEPRATKNR